MSVSEGAVVGVCAARGLRRARAGRAGLTALALLELTLLSAGAGCNGPGLEPPWSDDGEGSARTTTDNSGGVTVSPPAAEGPGTNGFGNPMSGGAGSSATTGGSGGTPAGTASPPVATAGSGSVSPPPASEPEPSSPADAGAPNDPDAGMAGTGAGNALAGIDFVPGCDAERPVALEGSEACRYPLADAYPAADLASLQVAALDGGDAALLERGQSALSCLFGSGYYIDETTTPAAIVLCAEACSALPPTAQLVAIEGCAPLP